MKSNKIVWLLLIVAFIAINMNPDPIIDWHAILMGAWLSTAIAYFFIARHKKQTTIMLHLWCTVIFFNSLNSIDPYAFVLGFAISPMVFLAGMF